MIALYHQIGDYRMQYVLQKKTCWFPWVVSRFDDQEAGRLCCVPLPVYDCQDVSHPTSSCFFTASRLGVASFGVKIYSHSVGLDLAVLATHHPTSPV